MKKRYVGKKIKPPYDQPQTEQIPNPAKRPIQRLPRGAKSEIKKLVKGVNNYDDCEWLVSLANKMLDDCLANSRERDTITQINWEGSLVQEFVKCGKETCSRCNNGGEGHGPYWYCYRSPT